MLLDRPRRPSPPLPLRARAPRPLPSDRRVRSSRRRPPPMRPRRSTVSRVRLAAAWARCAAVSRCGPPGHRRRAIEQRRLVAEAGDGRGEIDRVAAGSLVESSFDLGNTENIAKRAAHSTERRSVAAQPCSAAGRRFVPVAECEVDIGRGGVADGLMASVDGLRVPPPQVERAPDRSRPRRAASIAFARASRSRPTGSVSATGWRARTPATSAQRPRRVSASAASESK